MKLIASLAVLGASLLASACPAPAQGAEPTSTEGRAAITQYAVYRNPAATEVDQVVYLAAGPKSWKIKKAAAQLDAQIDGLTIIPGVPGSCDRMPTALCVDVVVGSWDEAAQMSMTRPAQLWSGLMNWHDDNHRVIYLNSFNTPAIFAKGVATHELGHALGLDHDDWGRMATNDNATTWFTDSELYRLRDWFSVPRYR